MGSQALLGNTTGYRNTGVGVWTQFATSNGSGNTSLGYFALLTNEGSDNIAIGDSAGSNVTTGNDNIYIGHPGGSAAEGATIRIGDGQTRAFLAGVRGTTTGAANAIPVLVDSNGQLGTISSSRRLKQDIEALDEEAARLLALRPVRFRYRAHAIEGDTTPQYGLIAEEVAEVFPQLVVYDAEGRPETVRSNLLVPLLLGELQRQRADDEARWRAMAARLEALESRAARPPGRGN